MTQALEHRRAKQGERKMRGTKGRRSEGRWSGTTRSSLLSSSLHGLQPATINCWCCVFSSQRLFCQRNAGLGGGREGRSERWRRGVITGQRGTGVYQADHAGQGSSSPDAPSPPDQSTWGHTVDTRVFGNQVAREALAGDLRRIVFMFQSLRANFMLII